MKNIMNALIRFVQRKWHKPRYIEAKVTFFEFMTTTDENLKKALKENGFDLNRPIEKILGRNQCAYIYRQEIIK